MTAEEAAQSPTWALRKNPRSALGYAYGSFYPTLLIELTGAEIPIAARQKAEAGLLRLLPALAGHWPRRSVASEAAPAEAAHTIDWWLALVDAVQQGCGLPVFELARVLESAGESWRCAVPTMPRSIAPLAQVIGGLLRLIPSLIDGPLNMALQTEVARLYTALGTTGPHLSNVPRVMRAAHDLGIPFRELPGQFLQFGDGAKARWLDSTFTDATPYISTQLARDKMQSAAILRAAGLPVPLHQRVATSNEALAAAKAIGFPVVVKPIDQDGGKGVAAGLLTMEEVERAFAVAGALSKNVLVEKHIEGRDYRLTVLHDRVIWAVERVPGGVTGDGTSTVEQLIAAANADPRRGAGPHSALKKLLIDEEAATLLARQGLEAASVPEQGRFVRLRRNSNVATGGMPVAVFDKVHPDNAALAVRAARTLRLDIAGVDLLIPDIARSWREGGAAICEVNAQPQLGGTTSAAVYPAVLRELMGGGDGRVPVVILAGMEDGGALAGRIAAALEARGLATGLHDAAGLRLREEWLTCEPVPLLAAGNILAMDRRTQAMVLSRLGPECLARGLPVQRFNLLVEGPQKLSDPELAVIRPALTGARLAAADLSSPQGLEQAVAQLLR
ncbi:ATP-binding protein [Alteraurantiacibacter palmitatis]|uniref:Acetate--CoA ligase family protein n=1 Tax=Alteraurantiacibacter palmitatis TaxID=2054628 RepID=A0ABV7E4A4_9SPHN